MKFSFIKPAKYFLTLSAALVGTSLVLLFYPGPNLSIDFTGGTLIELKIPSSSTKEGLSEALSSLTFENGSTIGYFTISATKAETMLTRMRDLSNPEHLELIDHLTSTLGTTEELQFTTIGPTVGASLKKRSLWALSIASTAIVLYIAFAFRKVPRRLSPWRFGIIAVVTLLHDVLITVGIFVILSHVSSFEFDTLFVTALLTILGYSVNDTIVIFDRIRDNLLTQHRGEEFHLVAERSLQQSVTRSINTSVSTLIMLSALFILGSESIRWFVLTLMVGAIIGTYSSLFLATPLLVFWRKKY
ncbi:protein translocase subunit SecF [Patescibacteria group bacterium]|nr:protein translocase subunit SecF [Patescibacteria group bacterium]MBU1123174.1 protein translocase subunit SecF [Patescibacteria group bacterium]MBU1911517.1 protein translocase subunit SecF [Patescibacteria group bacterium]